MYRFKKISETSGASSSRGALQQNIERDVFVLKRQSLIWLLILFSAETLSALIMAARIAEHGISPGGFVVGTLWVWMVRSTVKLLAEVLQSICR